MKTIYDKWQKILLKITRTIERKVINIIIKNRGCIENSQAFYFIKKNKNKKKGRKENKRIKIYRIKIEDNEHSFPVHPIKLNEPFDYPRSGV